MTESELRELFSEVGPVTQVRLPLDRETGRPRGFAFVDLADRAQADEAMRLLHQKVFKGRPLAVNEAVAREEGGGGARAPGGGGPPRGFSGAPSARAGGDGPPPPPSGERRRNYGADAAPRSKRKAEPWATKGPSAPIKEVGAAGVSRGGFDDDDDDDGVDEKPFWEMAEDPTDEDQQES